jgi:hypothetical protein
MEAGQGCEVLEKVAAQTTPGSLYCTDEWQAYAALRLRREHLVIRNE